MREVRFFLILSLLCIGPAIAQSPTATINGIVLDPSGAPIAGAQVVVASDATGVQYTAKTNGEGIYVVPNLPPGSYRIQVSDSGFKTIIKPEIVIHVQDALAINFTLPIGAASEIVTVQGGAPLVDTENAAVSTVVDRQFAENLPMNGRSFQTLIQLTPGVVVTTSNLYDAGQFSVNGQRTSSNYWMVDGVSANIGVSAVNPGNGIGGSLGSFSVLGGTNSLVSVDALQEFRIQTSTYAPEFGRVPGAQISIATRSGTSQFHGSAFDYFRNDALDANDWFANYNKLPKPEERQNDFGGTFNGPILRDRTFFFFSYEGLRLRLPQVAQTTVPSASARQNASPALQPYLNAFPLPNPNAPDTGTNPALLNASYSNRATLDAYSMRADQRLRANLNLFARYNYSPSEIVQRGNGLSLSSVTPTRTTIQTATVGTTWSLSPTVANDLRLNYSRANAVSNSFLDNFGGAVPLSALPFPSPFTSQNGSFFLQISSLSKGGIISQGKGGQNLQRQINVVDSISLERGSHNLKFGVDVRRLSPVAAPPSYSQFILFSSVASAQTGNAFFKEVVSSRSGTFLFKNLGVFAQDTWRIVPRLTLTYGLRWDVDFAPSSTTGAGLAAVTGFNLSDLSQLALAPAGTSPFETRYGNIAPRLGLAYQISQRPAWGTVFRGGFGVFFDLATQEVGNLLVQPGTYPLSAAKFNPAGTFPLGSGAAAPPPIAPPTAANHGELTAFDPNLKLPYTLQWNVALEQALGKEQSLAAFYIGSIGRRLIQSELVSSPSPNFTSLAYLVTNASTSDYHALQLQFQRRLSHGLQALSSYTWSHSIDTASAGSLGGNVANDLVSTLSQNANRGASDFDIRNAFSAGMTYDVPSPKINSFGNAILRGWSIQSVVQARSAPPVDVSELIFGRFAGIPQAEVRPDAVPGQPFYLYGPQCAAVLQAAKLLPPGQGCPGGKGFNPAAFTVAPFDPKTFLPLRQGTLSRNALRGFGATQWDFGVHRAFPIHELLHLEFRAEIFNILNHPNFGPLGGKWLPPLFGGPAGFGFGVSSQILSQSLAGNVGGGAFNPLYQIGGPRSVQLALKLQF